MAWDDVTTEVAELFAPLGGCFDMRSDFEGQRSVWTWMHRGTAKDVGIRTRRIGRDPGYAERKRAYDREYRSTKREADRLRLLVATS